MVETAVHRVHSREEALSAVAQLAPVIRERAQQAEDDRTLPMDVVDAVSAAALWAVFTPRVAGGAGLGALVDQYEIVRAMAYEDSSAGWALFICAGSPMLIASRLSSAGREEVFARGVTPMAGVFMPGGQARRADGGFVVSGRWQFGSGVHHAAWVMANAIVVDGDGRPVPTETAPVDVRSVVVPGEQVAIVDDWHVAGLRGTGSMSFTMDDVFVPDRRTFPFYSDATIDEAPFRVPIFTMVGGGFAGYVVGVAQRAIDEVVALLPARRRPPTFQPASENPVAQLALGRAIAATRAADESTRAVFARYDELIAGPEFAALSIGQRAEIHQQVVWAAETCAQTVSDLFRLSGASAIYEPGVLQRCWRDLGVVLQHIYMGANFHEIAAKVALGLPVEAPNV